MKINYTLKNKPAITKSYLQPSSINNALFYVDKGDVVSFETSYSNTFDFASKIFKTENLKTIFKVQSNTTSIEMTNIQIDSEPYFYEVVTSDSTLLSANDILLSSEFDVKALNGKVYTNTLISNYEISDGVFIHSNPVVHPSDITIKFYDRHILLSTPKSSKALTYFARPSTDTVAEVRRISDHKIEIPSFYLETRSSVIKVIEGDVVLHTKTELLPVEYNKVSLKDKLFSTENSDYYVGSNNNLFTKDAYLNREEVLIKYIAKFSSHIFEIENVLYFKIENGFLVESDNFDYDIKIKRIVDLSKISIHVNDFLYKNSFSIKASSYGLDFNGSLTDNYKRSLTNYFKPKILLNPSKQVYISLPSKTIYQENYNSFSVTKVSKEEILNLIDEDYSFNTLSLEDHSKVLVKDIRKTYYEV